MLTILTLGVLSSIVAELVTWLNAKLSGTVLKGKAAFLFALIVALLGGAFQVWHNGIPLNDWGALYTSFSQIWAVSQVFFIFIVQQFGLDVGSAPSAK